MLLPLLRSTREESLPPHPLDATPKDASQEHSLLELSIYQIALAALQQVQNKNASALLVQREGGAN